MNRILALVLWAAFSVVVAFVSVYYLQLDLLTGQFEAFVELIIYGAIVVGGYLLADSVA